MLVAAFAGYELTMRAYARPSRRDTGSTRTATRWRSSSVVAKLKPGTLVRLRLHHRTRGRRRARRRLHTPHGASRRRRSCRSARSPRSRRSTRTICARWARRSSSRNAYHLHLRPGDELVRAMGGLHAFMAWDGPILTDSGGFQVFSLAALRRVTEDGVEFRVHIDGSPRAFTPESVMQIERNLGADVIMQFDHVIPGQSDEAAARDASERSLRWLERCAARSRATATPSDVVRRSRRSSRSCRAASTRSCGAPPPQSIRDSGDWVGYRHRRAVGGRGEAGDVSHARGVRRRPSARPSALPHGRRLSRRPRRRRAHAASTCSTASRRRGWGGTARRSPATAGSTSSGPSSASITRPLDESATARPAADSHARTSAIS